MAAEYEVTSVRVNPTADRAHRMHVYFAAMTVRVLCVASLFFVRGWWLLLVGTLAIVLPYFAVLVANAAEHRLSDRYEAPKPLELTSGVAPKEPATPAAETIIVIDAPAERRSTGQGSQ